MAKQFKVGYKTRLKLQRAIQQQIQQKGLLDTYALKDSVRVSSATGDLNQLYVTINAIYYYMFLDKGADLWNGGVIDPFDITQDALSSQLGKDFQKECVDAYVNWMLANYPILDVGKISVSKLKVNIKYNLYGDESGKWNGFFDY
jgi:hypothetical protein